MNRPALFEVGLRDGLQNESAVVSIENKVELIQKLILAGVNRLELGSFVRADKVPQMADTDALFEMTYKGVLKGAAFYGLIPNEAGFKRAEKSHVKGAAFFSAVTETFNQKNIGMSRDEAFEGASQMVKQAKILGWKTRAYLSTVFACPFEGRVSIAKALPEIERWIGLECDELSLGDTIGFAGPNQVAELLTEIKAQWGLEKIAVHFHDTRGTALVNAVKAYDLGIRIFDASCGGLGGCPFAPGATGNLASEDLIYCFNEMGLDLGIDLEKYSIASLAFHRAIGKIPESRYLRSVMARIK